MGQKVLYGRAKKNGIVYPVRNNAPLGFESQRLEFLTGFIPLLLDTTDLIFSISVFVNIVF